MDEFLVTTHEPLRVERSTQTTSAPVTVRFSFLFGYDVFLVVTAEVTEERDGDGTTGHDVTILQAIEEYGAFDLLIYDPSLSCLRKAIEEQAIVKSHLKQYHIKK